jgi:hypothetical protein
MRTNYPNFSKFMRINTLLSLNGLLALGTLISVLFGSGCTSTRQQPPPSNQTPGNQVSTPNAPPSQNDPLSYGAVTSTVKKGVTTQEEIVRLFGPPNITTVNASGDEVWVYDRISNTSQQNGSSEARFNAFFGLKTADTKEATATANATSAQTSTLSTRTLTVIVNFDSTKKVKDYSARATQF